MLVGRTQPSMKMNERVKQLEKSVHGNGEEGLVHKVSSLQKNYANLSASHEKLVKTMDTIKRLMWFIAGVLAYSAVGSNKVISAILKSLS